MLRNTKDASFSHLFVGDVSIIDTQWISISILCSLKSGTARHHALKQFSQMSELLNPTVFNRNGTRCCSSYKMMMGEISFHITDFIETSVLLAIWCLFLPTLKSRSQGSFAQLQCFSVFCYVKQVIFSACYW